MMMSLQIYQMAGATPRPPGVQSLAKLKVSLQEINNYATHNTHVVLTDWVGGLLVSGSRLCCFSNYQVITYQVTWPGLASHQATRGP